MLGPENIPVSSIIQTKILSIFVYLHTHMHIYTHKYRHAHIHTHVGENN